MSSQTRCEVCENSNIRSLFKKAGYPYQICDNCGLIRIYPQLSDEELDNIYNNGYHKVWGEDENVFNELKRLTFAKLLEHFPNVKRAENRKLLDIGAATGILMQIANEKGYEVFGIEAARDVAELIAKRFGEERVFNGYFNEEAIVNKWGKNYFDVICMVDLLEHLRDPNQALQIIHSLLKDRGSIIIVLPDTISISRYILGRQWGHFLPEHLYSFSKKNIKMLLEKNGFNVVICKSGPKYLTLEYARNVLKKMYPGKFGLFMFKLIGYLPKYLLNKPFRLNFGEMFVLATKK